MQEESQRDIEDEEEEKVQIRTTLQMKDPAMWKHHCVGILKNCRTTHMEQEAGDDEDPEVLMAQAVAADPFEARLKPISGDSQVIVSKNMKI